MRQTLSVTTGEFEIGLWGVYLGIGDLIYVVWASLQAGLDELLCTRSWEVSDGLCFLCLKTANGQYTYLIYGRGGNRLTAEA
jgi:hypothetical protein